MQCCWSWPCTLSPRGSTLAIPPRILRREWHHGSWNDCHSFHSYFCYLSSGLSQGHWLLALLYSSMRDQTFGHLKANIIIMKLSHGLACSFPLWARTVASILTDLEPLCTRAERARQQPDFNSLSMWPGHGMAPVYLLIGKMVPTHV